MISTAYDQSDSLWNPMPVIFPLWGRFMEMRRLSGEVKGTEAFIGREEIPLSLGRMEPSAMNAQRLFCGQRLTDKFLILCKLYIIL